MYILYIPLCLYFNIQASGVISSSNNFTFHYVSILIDLTLFDWEAQKPFTFHYVSILIRFLVAGYHPEYNLHSIMSLF